MASIITSENDWNLPRPERGEVHRWLTVPLGLCTLGALCFSIDVPVAQHFLTGHTPKLLKEILDNAEPFGHACGVGLILVAMFLLDPARRTWIPACLVGAIGGGLSADLIKTLISRTRPRNLEASLTTVWDTFGPLLPLVNRTAGDTHSFPSAHTATATGLAVVLAAMYPQARWFFFCCAALTGLHRVQSSAHFPSDVCFGAAAGWLVGQTALVLHRRYLTMLRGPADAVGGL